MDTSDETPHTPLKSDQTPEIKAENINLDVDTAPESTTPSESTVSLPEPQEADRVEVKPTKTPIKQRFLKILTNPTPKQSIICASLTILIIATAGYYIFLKPKATPSVTQSQPIAEKRLGVAVGLLEGTAEYSTNNGKTWQPLTTETNLKEGNNVRTAANSKGVLLIDDGSAVRLDASSQVKLTDLATNHVVVTNVSGDVYSRVVASSTRTYEVKVNDETYTAKGTAYRTINKENKKGVEVFHSTVSVKTTKADITEGNYFLTDSEQADKTDKVLALDVEALKVDAFIKWNYDQDKKTGEFADKLGILTQLDKPAATKPTTTTPKPAASLAGITLTGKQSEYSAVFSWKVSGVDTTGGYKLVRSKKTATPTYPNDSVAFIEAGKTSYTLKVGDGVTYTYRLCAYRSSTKTCESYSNAVAVTTTAKPKESVQAGAVTMAINSGVASWTFAGTAPYGFKVLVGTSSGPTYENNYKKLYTDNTNYNLSTIGLNNGTTYYIRVCKYTDSGCTDYSNELTYIP